jgi:hypothetical protein
MVVTDREYSRSVLTCFLWVPGIVVVDSSEVACYLLGEHPPIWEISARNKEPRKMNTVLIPQSQASGMVTTTTNRPVESNQGLDREPCPRLGRLKPP